MKIEKERIKILITKTFLGGMKKKRRTVRKPVKTKAGRQGFFWRFLIK